jgi:hypothetical protein
MQQILTCDADRAVMAVTIEWVFDGAFDVEAATVVGRECASIVIGLQPVSRVSACWHEFASIVPQFSLKSQRFPSPLPTWPAPMMLLSFVSSPLSHASTSRPLTVARAIYRGRISPYPGRERDCGAPSRIGRKVCAGEPPSIRPLRPLRHCVRQRRFNRKSPPCARC